MVHNAATMQARADAGGKDPSPEAVQAYEQKFAAVPRAVLQGMTGEGAQLATAGAGAAEKAGAGAASAATAQRTATLTPAEVEKIRAEAAQIPLKGAADIANLRAQAAEAYARARAAGPEAQAKVMASLVELDKQLQERGAPSIFPGAGTGPGKHDVPGGQLVGAPLPPEEETRLRSGQNAVQNIERVENAPQNPKSTIKDMGLGAAAARMTQGKLPFFGEVKLGNTQDLKDLEDQTEAERAQMREWFKNVRPGGGTDEEAAAYSNMLPMPTGTDLVGGNKERFLKRRQDAIDRFKAEIRQGSSGRYKFSEPEQGGTVRMKGPKGTFDVPAGKVDKFKANGYQVGG
jgi:hypothetical protein